MKLSNILNGKIMTSSKIAVEEAMIIREMVMVTLRMKEEIR